MGAWWTNQLTAIETAAGTSSSCCGWPGESEGERTGMYLKPAMYVSMSADTECPDAAAKFIDFMLNSEAAGELLLSDRGLPANTDVREAISGDFSPSEQKAADFIADVEDEIVDGAPVPPVGAGEVAAILDRYNTEVLFERMTPRGRRRGVPRGGRVRHRLTRRRSGWTPAAARTRCGPRPRPSWSWCPPRPSVVCGTWAAGCWLGP